MYINDKFNTSNRGYYITNKGERVELIHKDGITQTIGYGKTKSYEKDEYELFSRETNVYVGFSNEYLFRDTEFNVLHLNDQYIVEAVIPYGCEGINLYYNHLQKLILPASGLKYIDVNINYLEHVDIPDGVTDLMIGENELKHLTTPRSLRKLVASYNHIEELITHENVEFLIVGFNNLESLSKLPTSHPIFIRCDLSLLEVYYDQWVQNPNYEIHTTHYPDSTLNGTLSTVDTRRPPLRDEDKLEYVLKHKML